MSQYIQCPKCQLHLPKHESPYCEWLVCWRCQIQAMYDLETGQVDILPLAEQTRSPFHWHLLAIVAGVGLIVLAVYWAL